MNKINTTDAVVSFGTQFVLTTNQGVVGSIPASRTKWIALKQRCFRAFSYPVLFISAQKWGRLHGCHMNKAFTKESDNADDDDLQLPPIPVGGKNYMTPQGYAALRGELLDLIDVERPKIVDVVHWAASNGDRSENGDYIYGKKRLREIDRRIRFLTQRMEIAEIANPAVHHGNDQIFFGATVTYADEAGHERTVTITGIDEAGISGSMVRMASI